MAFSIWLLVDGIQNRAATVARALILPYAILYTAFDSIVGIATGTAIQKANELPAAGQAATGRLIDSLQEADPAGYALYFATGLSFLAAVLAVVVALRDRAAWQPLVLMTLGATIFAIAHPKPTGRSEWACSWPGSSGSSCGRAKRKCRRRFRRLKRAKRDAAGLLELPAASFAKNLLGDSQRFPRAACFAESTRTWRTNP